MNLRRWLPHGFWFLLTTVVAWVVVASTVQARVGGGQSFGGGGGGSGGSSDGDGLAGLIWLLLRLLFWLTFEYPAIGIPVDLVIVAAIVGWWFYSQSAPAAPSSSFAMRTGDTEPRQRPVAETVWDGIREFDPNFSQVLFADFGYALYAAVQEARGRKQLDNYAPYLSRPVIEQFQRQSGADLKAVHGVIVAAFRVVNVSNPARARIAITVEFETNYTETTEPNRSTTWYSREQWTFVRNRDVLSHPPQATVALHCPKCGGALETNPDGTCRHCGTFAGGGAFDWFVTRIRVLTRENQGPLLTQTVPEVGTDRLTIRQPQFAAVRSRFMALNPGFDWTQFTQRVEHIFRELQAAWSDRKWERARPYVSDQMFQTQLYWITEYRRQHLRNVLDDVRVDRTDPVKISMDAFYDALTVRIFASMIDYTVDEQGKLICGDKDAAREFSEYWTFIRRRGVKPSAHGDANCPNCGAPLKINMAGICEYCQGKVTNGAFDWVLSRIEQDEVYRG
jgi:predicted lipid-binding transport protein (Tim44 family)